MFYVTDFLYIQLLELTKLYGTELVFWSSYWSTRIFIINTKSHSVLSLGSRYSSD